MPSRFLSFRGRALLGLAVPVLSILLAAPARAEAPASTEILPVGESRERPIAAGETHSWQTVVTPATDLLVTVEQHGIDLTVKARKLGDREPVTADRSDNRWGLEVLLLKAAGEVRIEIRPREKSAWPGRYILRIEALPADGTRRDALALMSRAGQEALPDTPDSRLQAIATYRQALTAWRSLGERTWEAETLTSLAILEIRSSQLQPATADLLAALTIWRELGNPYREADSLNRLGILYLGTQSTEEIRTNLESALSQWHHLGEQFEEAKTQTNLCALARKAGSLPESLACFQENLALFQGSGMEDEEADILNSIGGLYDLLGEPDAAQASYQQALNLWRTLGDHDREAKALQNLAVLHRALGDWQEALRLYDEVREILPLLGDHALEGSVFNNIGFLYNGAGQPQRALPYLETALKLRREVGNRAGEITTLNNLGITWRNLGDLGKALDHHRQALALAVSLSDVPQQEITRLRLAEAQIDRGDAGAALSELDAGLAMLREKGNPRTKTDMLHQRGRALALAGRTREALVVFQEALARRREFRDRAGEAGTLDALALAERSLGLSEDALSHAQAAVTLVEELRTSFLSADLRASFLATRRQSFSILIDLLMDRHAAEPGKGHDREAFAISERARARGLLDVLRAGSAGQTANAAPPEWLTRRGSLLRRLNAKVDQRWKQSGPRAEALDKEIDTILTEVDAVEAEIRRHDPRFAAFSAPQPVSPEEISAGLEPGTMLLEYSLGEARSFLWAIEAGRIRSFVLPPQKEIEALARRVYEEVSTAASGNTRQGSAAAALSRILLGPVWSDRNGTALLRRLVVVPDGALAILPFSVLPVPDPGKSWQAPGAFQPLLDSLEVVSIPSATTLAVQRQRLERRAPAPKLAAVFADPVFAADDPRLGQRSATHPSAPPKVANTELALRGEDAPVLERLPATHGEAVAVAGLAPAGQVWIGLGLEASREAVVSGRLHDYRILHFATHAVADTRNPELSGLVLSQVDAEGRPREGFLSLSDIYELDLDADLVVLSGCRTALGKEVRGEGVLGLTRGFQYAGVPRVVASLWRVQDRATAELMTRFYQAMWRDHLPPAAALRKAQRSLRHNPRYRDPYSWAGFVLQGDWH